MVKTATCEGEFDFESVLATESKEKPKTTEDSNSQDINEKSASEPKAWGFDLYPERRGFFQPEVMKTLRGSQGQESLDKIKCERSVYDCIQTSPIVKLMMGALKSSGCPLDIRRHISCEVCDPTVTGGYDPELNQIVVCQNMAKKNGIIQSVLAHEMVHMFDYCRKELDFKNMEHLACTEIRAANLTHCSFMSAWSQGDASFTRIAARHQDCVKTKALYSVLAVRQIGKEEAIEIVEKVFPYCYRDLEPVGRRIKRNSDDMLKAYKDSRYYGYST